MVMWCRSQDKSSNESIQWQNSSSWRNQRSSVCRRNGQSPHPWLHPESGSEGEEREAHFLNLPSSSFPSFSLDRRTKSYHKKCKVSLPFPEHLTPSFRAVCELAPPANGTFSDCFCTLASGPSRPHSAAGTHSCRQPVLTKPWLPRGRQHALSFF